MNTLNNPVILTPEEKAIISEELYDVKHHVEALIEDQVFDNDIEKEEAINRVDVIDNVLRKLT